MQSEIPYSWRVAIDFDNTIVDYDDLFLAAACERNLVSSAFRGTTHAVRAAVRRGSGGESEWQKLQAHVYGELIDQAPAFAGAREFMVLARESGVRLAIVSHKTMFAAAHPGGRNLQHAARRWLAAHGMVGAAAVAEEDVYFESSRLAKISRIRELEVDIAIDDLVEVLMDRMLPARTRRWLFAPGAVPGVLGRLERFQSWPAMEAALALCRRTAPP